MTSFFKTKKRGPRGEGRTVKFKSLRLPEEIIDELRLYKDYYSIAEATEKDSWGNPIPVRVSFEQILRHWMDNLDALDPYAYADVQKSLRFREDHPSPVMYDVDPFMYPIDKFVYHFETDDGEVAAEFNGETFVCSEEYMDFKGKTLEEMYNHNWPLANDGGYEFSYEKALELCRRMKKVYKRKAAKKDD